MRYVWHGSAMPFGLERTTAKDVAFGPTLTMSTLKRLWSQYGGRVIEGETNKKISVLMPTVSMNASPSMVNPWLHVA